jgi:hypothetical protein
MSKREPVRREERVEPTPETLAKLIPDPIQELFDKGLITGEHTTAAAEIRAIYFAVVGSLFCRGRDYRVFGRGRGNMPERLAVLHRDRYKPWARSMGANLCLMIDALIDGRWVPQQILIDGLTAYIGYCGPARHTIAIDNRSGMLDSTARM